MIVSQASPAQPAYTVGAIQLLAFSKRHVLFDLALPAWDNGRVHIKLRSAGKHVLCFLTVVAFAGLSPAAHAADGPVEGTQVGVASWYGPGFNGHKTANGDRFDMNALTCAHRTLPLGSWVRVTNLKNGMSTLLRVTDRGPFVRRFVVDLSLGAARRLGIAGVGQVRLEPAKGHLQIAASATFRPAIAELHMLALPLLATPAFSAVIVPVTAR